MLNVRPCVARRPPSRDEPTIRTFEVSPSQVCTDVVGKGLFHSHFSTSTPVCNKNYRGVGHLNAIARSLQLFPHTKSRYIFDFRDYSIPKSRRAPRALGRYFSVPWRVLVYGDYDAPLQDSRSVYGKARAHFLCT